MKSITELKRKIALEILEDIRKDMEDWTLIPSSDYFGYGGFLETDVCKSLDNISTKYETEGIS